MHRHPWILRGLVVVALAGFGPAQATAAPSSDLVPSPSTVDFGTIDTHQQPQQTVSFMNTNVSGNGADAVFDAFITGPDAGSFAMANNQDFCSGNTIAPGTSCQVKVAFNPQSSPGTKNAVLHVDDASGSVDVPLTGASISGTLTASPTSMVFGGQVVNSNQGSDQVQVTLAANPTNATDAQNNPISVNAGVDIGGNMQITGPDASSFSIAYGNCANDNLGPGNNCNETLAFNPTTPGPKTADLVVASDAANGTVSIPLTGTGLNGPTISFSPSQEDFGTVTVGNHQSATLTLTNTGDAPLGIQEAFIVAGSPQMFPITADTCSQHQINPGGSCRISVDFSPTTPGDKAASLFFITSANMPVTTLGLTGTGIATPTPAVLGLPDTASSASTIPIASPDLARISGSLIRTGDCRSVQATTSLAVGGHAVRISVGNPTTRTAPLRLSANQEIEVRIDGIVLAAGQLVRIGPATLAYYADGTHTLSVSTGGATMTTPLILGPCQLSLSVAHSSDQAVLRISSRQDVSSLTARLAATIQPNLAHPLGHITIRTARQPPLTFDLSSRRTVLDGVTVTLSAHQVRITGLPVDSGVILIRFAVGAPTRPGATARATGTVRGASPDTTTVTVSPRGAGHATITARAEPAPG